VEGWRAQSSCFFRTNDDQENPNEISDMCLHRLDPYLSAIVGSNGDSGVNILSISRMHPHVYSGAVSDHGHGHDHDHMGGFQTTGEPLRSDAHDFTVRVALVRYEDQHGAQEIDDPYSGRWAIVGKVGSGALISSTGTLLTAAALVAPADSDDLGHERMGGGHRYMVAVSSPVGSSASSSAANHNLGSTASGHATNGAGTSSIASGIGAGRNGRASPLNGGTHDAACVWKYLADLSSIRHLPYDDGSSASTSTNASSSTSDASAQSPRSPHGGGELREGAFVVVARRSYPGQPILPEAAGKLLQRNADGTWDVQLIDAIGKKYCGVEPSYITLQDMSSSRPRRAPSPAVRDGSDAAAAISSGRAGSGASGRASGAGEAAQGSVVGKGAVTLRLSIEAKPARAIDDYGQSSRVGYFLALECDGKTPCTANSLSGSSPFIGDDESFLRIFSTRPIRWDDDGSADAMAAAHGPSRQRPQAQTLAFPNYGRFVSGNAGDNGGRAKKRDEHVQLSRERRLILPSFPIVAGLGPGHRSSIKSSSTPKGSLKARLFAPPARLVGIKGNVATLDSYFSSAGGSMGGPLVTTDRHEIAGVVTGVDAKTGYLLAAVVHA